MKKTNDSTAKIEKTRYPAESTSSPANRDRVVTDLYITENSSVLEDNVEQLPETNSENNSNNLVRNSDSNSNEGVNDSLVDNGQQICTQDGFFADKSTNCRTFYRCLWSRTSLAKKVEYTCPDGTLFNQAVMVCDWAFNVEC